MDKVGRGGKQSTWGRGGGDEEEEWRAGMGEERRGEKRKGYRRGEDNRGEVKRGGEGEG